MKITSSKCGLGLRRFKAFNFDFTFFLEVPSPATYENNCFPTSPHLSKLLFPFLPPPSPQVPHETAGHGHRSPRFHLLPRLAGAAASPKLIEAGRVHRRVKIMRGGYKRRYQKQQGTKANCCWYQPCFLQVFWYI